MKLRSFTKLFATIIVLSVVIGPKSFAQEDNLKSYPLTIYRSPHLFIGGDSIEYETYPISIQIFIDNIRSLVYYTSFQNKNAICHFLVDEFDEDINKISEMFGLGGDFLGLDNSDKIVAVEFFCALKRRRYCKRYDKNRRMIKIIRKLVHFQNLIIDEFDIPRIDPEELFKEEDLSIRMAYPKRIEEIRQKTQGDFCQIIYALIAMEEL